MIDRKDIFVPSYYKDFKCIADKCRHSCCVDWEICIDNDTYAKYNNLADIFRTVTDSEDSPCFILNKDGRCPHLNDSGLCNIILSYGEEYLSEICRKHPRFYNYISGKRIEAGVGIVCEEACRLILENENPFSLYKIESLDNVAIDNSEFGFDAIPQREYIFSIIKSEKSFEEKIANLRSAFKLTKLYTEKEWINRFLSLEILNAEWKRDLIAIKDKRLKGNSEISVQYSKYYERLLAYFVYRHISVSDSDENLRARLAFCILSVEMIKLLFEENLNMQSILKTVEVPKNLIDWARRYSAEIEYSEDNIDELIFTFESALIFNH